MVFGVHLELLASRHKQDEKCKTNVGSDKNMAQACFKSLANSVCHLRTFSVFPACWWYQTHPRATWTRLTERFNMFITHERDHASTFPNVKPASTFGECWSNSGCPCLDPWNWKASPTLTNCNGLTVSFSRAALAPSPTNKLSGEIPQRPRLCTKRTLATQ